VGLVVVLPVVPAVVLRPKCKENIMDYLKPKGVNTKDLDKRRMEDGQFRNPPTFEQLGGFTSASKAFTNNAMTLERGGPTAVKNRPI
jgi:hypothetical protein